MITKTKIFIIVGVSLMLIGVIFPLLMVVQVIEATFLLTFISYLSSVIGLFLSSLAVMSWVKVKRDSKK